ncbi:acyl CoA:acetate/3-ketoacid CoA transferase [Mycobacterium aquaticum]|uniref:Acyl CoA:acetate/3-ketoacid CoA transferase n=1 Tax=Mycobacterium aquaticum TaxID=1927124 RepID=A0A1X0BAC8_9MYCO|nr:CoA-transferase [Mycobacterium aquaticum]ORA39169.1 acyl CoA:acetate/3-ketoacid CoA transferase [Mycobacterium aquaticum]
MTGARFIDADEVARTIEDGAVVALTGSGGGILEADHVFAAVERRFLAEGHPRDLTIVHGLGIGDGTTTGLTRFAHEGMVKRVIGGHWSWSPRMQELAATNAIEAYSFPAGVIAALLRDSGAGRPGLITKVGLHTFVDPRESGGKINAAATDDLVKLIEIDGQEYLHYRPLPVDVGIIRGWSADRTGNVSADQEASSLDAQAVAIAARGNGGIVVAQVRQVVADGALDPRLMLVPSPLVDVIVEHPEQQQSRVSQLEPAFYTPGHFENSFHPAISPIEGARGVIARRAAMEVQSGCVLNVGYGMSAGAVDVLIEQGRLDDVTLCIEQGPVGGFPETGALFGLSRYPQAVFSSLLQFEFFASGMIDLSILGMGEVDSHGNVNVSKLGRTTVGPGGFIDIVNGAKRVVFCGTFTGKGLKIEVGDGNLTIVAEGTLHKFVPLVGHLTFAAANARRTGQPALYITERAVFELDDRGITLVEVAPGVDLERDILAHMDFRPNIGHVRPMPAEVFRSSTQPGVLTGAETVHHSPTEKVSS